MWAMLLDKPGRPLRWTEVPVPRTGPGQVLVKVHACAVCRTDLHVADGDLKNPKIPLVLGHEIVGEIVEKARDVDEFSLGERVGIPWLGWTCGQCTFCKGGRENLCDSAKFTGYTLDGGYAEYAVADSRFCFRIPAMYKSAEAAPLLCAGLIGYRSLVMAGDAERLGIYGFGAAGHLVAQVAKHQGRRVFAFTRPGDTRAQALALEMGADWAGDSNTPPPELVDAAIIFAPVGDLVPIALRNVRKGGRVVCGGIHMSQIPAFPYELLWHEKTVCSVANLTRHDGVEFFKLAPLVPVRATIETYNLDDANSALDNLRKGSVRGAAVLLVGTA
ncbi:MAG: zinc-dependent alcohol dehydrogenase family protein [Verrucomicrobiae bacterium]|nr:zinc-dependent alcohol dehydrogenase family protein [Verrucomicrobiae bacterium]